jgi:RNA polymerase-binding transcription factor
VDLDAVRRELEARRDRTRGRVETLAERPELGAAQGFGKRIGDGTTEAISRLTDIGVGRSLETGLERVERALAKLDEGTYGTCDGCGRPIPEKRLAAMPESTLCVECAAAERRVPAPRR